MSKRILVVDDLLLLAVADVTVDGQRLEGVGVRPTIKVPFDPVYAAGRDTSWTARCRCFLRKVGPSRFPCGWRRVANRSRLASGAVERLS
jgi:hypothetical protein